MRAAVIVDKRLEVRDLPEPEPGPTQVLVAVRAAGLNRADLYARAGVFHGPPRPGPVVAGGEVAGEVIAVGAECRRWSVGDRVMAMAGGAFAERCVVDEAVAVAVPAGRTWTEAASLPVACCTEHDAIVTAARLQPGESVLVSGATSGVGIVALQIAHVFGATAIGATSRSAARAESLRPFGATFTVGTGEPGADLAEAARAATGGRGVDVVIDHVGASLLGPTLDAMALGGRLVSVGRLGGTTTPIDLDLVARKRLSIIGVTFRTRSRAQFAAIAQAMERDLASHLEAGTIGPPVALAVPLAEIEHAYETMAADAVLGKIVIAMEG